MRIVRAEKVIYKIITKVVALEERKRIQGWYQSGEIDESGKPIYVPKEETLGWFVTLEGSRESLYLGTERPGGKVGDMVTISLELRDNN